MRVFTLLLIFAIPMQVLFGQSYLNKLETPEDFEKLSGTPLVEKYGQVNAVKLVFDLNSEKLYFLNAKNYKYHYAFCNEYLNYRGELGYFNEHNYSTSKKRRFLLGNLNHFKNQNRYSLEIAASDAMEPASIIRLHQLVQQNTFTKHDLTFLLNSNRLQKEANHLKTFIPILYPSDIYGQLDYQAISKFKGRGILRFIGDFEAEKNLIRPNDIIVLNETPLYLPTVAGIIVSEFQTPLSHLTILGQNRKIPIAAYKKIFLDAPISRLKGKWVQYEVKSDTFLLRVSKSKRPIKRRQKRIKLTHDLRVDSLVGVENIQKRSSDFVGNKAANFGLLYQLSKKAAFKTPEGAFAIPFFFYDKHMESAGGRPLLEKILLLNTTTDQDSIRTLLKKLRKSITKTPLNKAFLSTVEKRISKTNGTDRMRFRSSTNAEDTKGFSGAGLYTSKTGILDHPKKTIEKAIKKVWASLWSYEAYMERAYFDIPQQQVFMGILVHRSFPNEAVNGVAITKNLYRKDTQGFVVNAQLGNENVVAPNTDITSDQFICYPDQADMLYKNTIDIITTSSLTNGELTMSQKEIEHLANQLALVKQYFHKKKYRSKAYLDLGIDVEFKLDGADRQLYIKQARIYND